MQLIKGFAFGVKNISPSELNEWSILDLWYSYIGYWNNENLRSRVTWENSRYVSYIILKGAGDKKLKKPIDLMRFPWEKDIQDAGRWTKNKIEQYKKSKFYQRHMNK